MATYYHGAPEIQTDGLQTLYLMNPSFVGYAADSSPPASNMAFMNNSGGANLPQTHQQQQQQFVGIPLPEIATAHGLFPRAQYHHHHHLWNISPANNSGDLTSQLGLRRTTQQRLSLSLSSQQGSYGIQPPTALVTTAMIGHTGAEEVRFSDGSAAPENEIVGEKVLLGSKYLKAAQQILDEVVSVGKGVNKNEGLKSMSAAKAKQEKDDGIDEKRLPAELSTAERQELQMKKAKLVNMLDEVEQRYRQYNHQMQAVISSFESIAGVGAATTYTTLALRTISKQFRCLRDAITGQIRATSKNMGEEDCKTDGGSGSTSRLRFVDHHLRQQKALQQLGMMQHNAWRPQRGLPERSVSVLRAWLFEHFLHPYPKDSDKHILAKQTGLTRNQVSNWFINARVRLWKPMVEEMYLEETKDQQPLVGDEIHKTSKSDDSKSTNAPLPETALYAVGDDDHDVKNHAKKPKSAADVPSTFLQQHHHLGGDVDEMDVKPVDAVDVNGGAVTDLFMRFNDNAGWFGAPRFSGNGVSLTLGLQHCEGLPAPTYQLSGDGGMALPGEYSNHAMNIAGEGVDDSPTSGYGNLTVQSRKRFAAPLLPDFVA